MTRIRRILRGQLMLLLLASPAWADPCVSSDACRSQLMLSTGKTIPYYASLPLAPSDTIEGVVIVVHGNSRNADSYYDRLVDAARAEDRLRDVLLLAPNFRTHDDDPDVNEHYWSSSGWKIGGKSLDAPTGFSSFAVMDEILERVCSPSAYPALRTVVIIGHSAGGQFVNRYTGGGVDCPNPAVEMRYVVMNPSSYLYLSDLRIAASGEFRVPSSCSWYDDYKYGLRDLNTYMGRVGRAGIRSNIFERRTYYLAGEQDTEKDSGLDVSCAGNLQGENRRARHEHFGDHAQLFSEWTESVFLTIPGVGHSGGGMIRNETTRRIMFHSDPELMPQVGPAPPVLLDSAPAGPP
jgi:hypothetical protein